MDKLNTKSALGSFGVWGGLIALIPSAVDAIDKLLALGVLPAGPIPAIVAGVGAILAIFGRVNATKEINRLVP